MSTPKPTVKKSTAFLVLALMAFLVFHFVCTLTYSLEWSPPNRLTAVRNQYMVPYFHQGWKLFAPDVPATQYELTYRYSKDGAWSDWGESETFEPISSHPRLAYVAQKLQMYLAMDMRKNLTFNPDSTINYDLVVNDVPYMRVLYFAVRRHEMLTTQRPDSIQMRMNVLFTPSFESGEQQPAQFFEFPVYTFNQ